MPQPKRNRFNRLERAKAEAFRRWGDDGFAIEHPPHTGDGLLLVGELDGPARRPVLRGIGGTVESAFAMVDGYYAIDRKKGRIVRRRVAAAVQ